MIKQLWQKIFPESPTLPIDFTRLGIDCHSHLLPGLDDGVQSAEEALECVQALYNLGFKKIVTTPHVMAEGFPNTNEEIKTAGRAIKKKIAEAHLPVQFEVAAEYYVDEHFEKKLEEGEPLLTIDSEYVLIEFSYLNKPFNSEEVIFKLQAKGYRPILAHPERYPYLSERGLEPYRQLRNNNVLLQVNISSFLGGYHPKVKKTAQQLARNGLIDLLSSDMHRLKQAKRLHSALQDKTLIRLLSEADLLNKELC